MIKLLDILGRRIALTQRRLLREDCPGFTPEFILADVLARDPTNRRFSNFSGDLSGRFVGALSLLPQAGSDTSLQKLMPQILRNQGTDGRFGNPDLDFFGAKIGTDHMPLLWGNGRLLVGLMEYYSRFPDSETLESAIRLGNFLLGVSDRCLREDTSKELISQGAAGFICFTQCNEGLVLLAKATGDSRYLEGAQAIAQWILPRGQQHSHGYLTTLRGVMMLYDSTKDAGLLATAEKAFAELVGSSDYLPAGGVPEYFGWRNDPLNKDAGIAAHSTSEPRDEGCSEADFLRLCLQLWQATASLSYMEKAEHCLLNHLLSNQFANGDFGHRHLTDTGFKPYPRPGRAWWCCTMHGLRAFKDVETAAVAEEGDGVRVNLFLDCDLKSEDAGIEFRNSYDQSSRLHSYTAKFIRGTLNPLSVFIREPAWADTVAVRLNGARIKTSAKNGYIYLNRRWKAGDELRVERSYKIQVQTEDKNLSSFQKALASAKENKIALHYGPWLLAIHGADNPQFYCEPSWNNSVFLPKTEAGLRKAWHQPGGQDSKGMLKLEYIHEGFPGRHELTLRPLCQQIRSDSQIADVFFRYRT